MTVRCGKGSWDVDKKEYLGELVSRWPAGYALRQMKRSIIKWKKPFKLA